MPPIVPETRQGKVEFYETRIPAWSEHAGDIGLDPMQVMALQTLTAEARASYDAAEAARSVARAATQDFHNKVSALHAGPGAGQGMIDAIRNHAKATNNPNVYVLAEIPAPKTPGAAPRPGKPLKFQVDLLQTGALKLRWTCDNPRGTQGTVYEVLRRVNGATDFTFVGATGVKKFTDITLPVGAAPVTYQITAVRAARGGSIRGEAARFMVSFGSSGKTRVTTNDTNEKGVKLAA